MHVPLKITSGKTLLTDGQRELGCGLTCTTWLRGLARWLYFLSFGCPWILRGRHEAPRVPPYPQAALSNWQLLTNKLLPTLLSCPSFTSLPSYAFTLSHNTSVMVSIYSHRAHTFCIIPAIFITSLFWRRELLSATWVRGSELDVFWTNIGGLIFLVRFPVTLLSLETT